MSKNNVVKLAVEMRLSMHDVQTRSVCREEVETVTGFRLPGEGDTGIKFKDGVEV